MNTFILDCGKSEAFYFNTTTKDTGNIKHQDLINVNIPDICNGDTLIIEDAHMRSRERNSLAQPFKYEQLVELQQNTDAMDVTILLFPQMSTPKARKWCGADEKNDLIDVASIAQYLTDHPRVKSNLKKFAPKTLTQFRDGQAHKWHDRSELNKDINTARNLGYEGDAVSDWINTNVSMLYQELTPELQEMLGMQVKFAGKAKEYVYCNRVRLYSVVVTLMKPDGSLRLRSDVHKLPYWKYAKEVYFAMTPYHMNGGVVASNVKHHWRRAMSTFRKTTSAKPLLNEEHSEMALARSEFDRKLQRIWNHIRGMILATA